MHSEKTTMLVQNFESCVHHNIPVTAITHALDNRRGARGITLASGRSISATHHTSLLTFAKSSPAVSSSMVVLVDEAQFFEDLVEGVEHLLSLRKHVYVYGLDSDFRRQKFGHVLDLVPLCDAVTKLTSRCSNCNASAIFTQRTSEDTSQVCVGSDMYAPRCRACYTAEVQLI
jgi:thymidine kinase